MHPTRPYGSRREQASGQSQGTVSLTCTGACPPQAGTPFRRRQRQKQSSANALADLHRTSASTLPTRTTRRRSSPPDNGLRSSHAHPTGRGSCSHHARRGARPNACATLCRCRTTWCSHPSLPMQRHRNGSGTYQCHMGASARVRCRAHRRAWVRTRPSECAWSYHRCRSWCMRPSRPRQSCRSPRGSCAHCTNRAPQALGMAHHHAWVAESPCACARAAHLHSFCCSASHRSSP